MEDDDDDKTEEKTIFLPVSTTNKGKDPINMFKGQEDPFP